MKKQVPGWLALTVLALAAGLLLALTNSLTADQIKAQSLVKANAARVAVLPAAQTFEEQPVQENTFGVDNCYAGKAGDETVGYASQITVKGYGGEIEVTVGMDTAGAITGVSVGGSKFSETAGLGAKTKEAKFTDQFKGLTPPAILKENVDSVTGASISSGAVVSGVNKVSSYLYLKELHLLSEESHAEADEVREKTVQGFGGEILITLGLDADDKIVYVDFGGENFNETAGLGERVTEQAFRDQFVGKSGPLAYGDGIDAITGATVTSTAVMQGINQLLGGEAEPAAEAAEPVAEAVEPAAEPVGEKRTATVKGFGGDVEVSIWVDGGAVTGMEVGGANFNETAGLGAKAQDKAFTDQFIGKSGTLAYGEGLDAITGATVTSTAVLGAVNELLAQ